MWEILRKCGNTRKINKISKLPITHRENPEIVKNQHNRENQQNREKSTKWWKSHVFGVLPNFREILEENAQPNQNNENQPKLRKPSKTKEQRK